MWLKGSIVKLFATILIAPPTGSRCYRAGVLNEQRKTTHGEEVLTIFPAAAHSKSTSFRPDVFKQNGSLFRKWKKEKKDSNQHPIEIQNQQK